MKKYLNRSLAFAVYGLLAGVYFRELTKFNGVTERTMLGMAHPHILMLGLGGFLVVALFIKVLNMAETKGMKFADVFYTAGLVVASVMMLVRGTMEVLGREISSGMSGMISGIAGLGHIAVAVGLVMFLNAFRKAA